MSRTNESEKIVVIATKKCLIKAKSVKHVTMTEDINRFFNDEDKETHFKNYTIEIYYICHDSNNGNTMRDSECKTHLVFYDKAEAEKIYGEIVTQVRDQEPDQMLIDKLFEEYVFNEGKKE